MGNERDAFLKAGDVVALLEAMPHLSLNRGTVGAVVLAHRDPRLVSVEFVINRQNETVLVSDIETRLLLPLMWWGGD